MTQILTESQAEIVADVCAWLRYTAEESGRDAALSHGALMSEDIAKEIEEQFRTWGG